MTDDKIKLAEIYRLILKADEKEIEVDKIITDVFNNNQKNYSDFMKTIDTPGINTKKSNGTQMLTIKDALTKIKKTAGNFINISEGKIKRLQRKIWAIDIFNIGLGLLTISTSGLTIPAALDPTAQNLVPVFAVITLFGAVIKLLGDQFKLKTKRGDYVQAKTNYADISKRADSYRAFLDEKRIPVENDSPTKFMDDFDNIRNDLYDLQAPAVKRRKSSPTSS